MTKVTVCIGSSCHLKGSRQIVEKLQELIKINKIDDMVNLSGTFCMGRCSMDGVSVSVDDEPHTIKVENVSDFFDDVILKKLK